jgi:hypothetical protein
MQRFRLEILRQMLRLFKQHFRGAHIRQQNGPGHGANQVPMRARVRGLGPRNTLNTRKGKRILTAEARRDAEEEGM